MERAKSLAAAFLAIVAYLFVVQPQAAITLLVLFGILATWLQG